MLAAQAYLWIDSGLVTYFLLLNGFYAFVLLLGFPVLYRRFQEIGSEELTSLLSTDHVPPITVIIPAHNEEKIIHEAISSVFHLEYPHFSLIVINDGSTDDTLNELKKKYELIQVPPAFPDILKTQPVKAYYRSKKHPNLMVIDKELGGQEDAQNAGINACTSPYFITTDADAIMEPDVLRLLSLSLVTRHNTIGVGGALRLANNCTVEDGVVKEVRLPSTYFTAMQVPEYLRGFFFGRLGWNILGGPFVLCGAFALHEKQAVIEIGGYGHQVPAADIDLTLRLHGKMHELKRPYNIQYVPDATIWTEVPQGYRDLSLQRQRWYCSIMDVVSKYKYMIFNPKYGRLGFLYLPYLLFGEGLGPLIEAFAYGYFLWCFIFGVLNLPFFIMFVLISLGYSTLLTFISLGMEQTTFKKYVSIKEVLKLVGLILIENLGYRQLSVYWRMRGFIRYFTKHRYYREHPERHVYKEK
ncbi:MAG: Poly-beta-1,6-N-acetyl-D-glucosamine synthase [Chlamydiae bacterium]|nr:Poly-beta-1,6-N-acetyl-D-glucosamine synthase [Chlamydiota bacterium]